MAFDSDLDVRATTRLGVSALVVAGLLLAVTALLAAVGGEIRTSRLTSRAVGTIESVRGEHDDVVTVTWTDSTGGAHRDDFWLSGEVDDIGSPFALRYDPTNPYGPVVADEPEQVAPPGREGSWAALAVLALVGVWLGAWAVRGRRNAAALEAVATAPAHPMTMVVASQTSGGAKRCVAVLVGPDVDLPTPFEHHLAFLRSLAAEDDDRAESSDPSEPEVDMPPSRAIRQPVVWEPVLDEVADRLTPVTVYGDLGRRRRVVIELPDGHRLTPAGRLQRRQPWLWDCSVRLAVIRAVHAALRARVVAGDGDALAPLRHAVPQEPGLTDAQVLTIPVDRAARRTLESPFDHKLWAVLTGGPFVGLTFGLAGAVVAVALLVLTLVAAWAWFGGDPE